MKGLKTGGRKAGTPNKVSTTVKSSVIAVFDQIGGVEHMAVWAAENRTEFYKLWARLLPTETAITGSEGGALATCLTVRFVGSDGMETQPMSYLHK